MLASFGVLQVFFSMIWFFVFLLWIMLLFRVFGDIFRSRDLGGAAKVFWLIFVIVLPYLGVFVYLIARGGKMAENELSAMQAQEAAARAYIRDAAGASPAEELARLADLRDRGVISEDEFKALKAKAVG